MKAIPYILIVLLAITTTAAVVTRPEPAPKQSIAERITLACKPWLVSDWWVSFNKDYLKVSCYDPKTARLRYTLVAR